VRCQGGPDGTWMVAIPRGRVVGWAPASSGRSDALTPLPPSEGGVWGGWWGGGDSARLGGMWWPWDGSRGIWPDGSRGHGWRPLRKGAQSKTWARPVQWEARQPRGGGASDRITTYGVLVAIWQPSGSGKSRVGPQRVPQAWPEVWQGEGGLRSHGVEWSGGGARASACPVEVGREGTR